MKKRKRGKTSSKNVINSITVALQKKLKYAEVKAAEYDEKGDTVKMDIWDNIARAYKNAIETVIFCNHEGNSTKTRKEAAQMQKEYVKSADDVNAAKCKEAHMKAYEKWPYGREIDTWKDESGNICIRYATGKWFHYKIDEAGKVQWW